MKQHTGILKRYGSGKTRHLSLGNSWSSERINIKHRHVHIQVISDFGQCYQVQSERLKLGNHIEIGFAEGIVFIIKSVVSQL